MEADSAAASNTTAGGAAAAAAATIDASWAAREVDLEESHGRQHLGRPRLNQSAGPRSVITARETFKKAIYAKVRGVYRGTFDEQPAVLLVTEFSFREKRGLMNDVLVTFTFSSSSSSSSSSAVTAMARATAAAAAAAAKPADANKPAASLKAESKLPGPAVRLITPKAIHGFLRAETHWLSYGGSFEVSVSVGPASAGPSAHVTKSVAKTVSKQLTVKGYDFTSDASDEDVADQAIFRIERNDAAEFPDSVYFGVVVERHQDIQAEVKIEINKRALGYPWSKKDDPLLLPVGWKTEKVIGTEPCRFETLGAAAWRELVPYRREGEDAVTSIE